jgi:hypothetical protein
MVSLPVALDEIKVIRKIENIDYAPFSIRHKIVNLKTCYFDDIEFVDGRSPITRIFNIQDGKQYLHCGIYNIPLTREGERNGCFGFGAR